MSIQSSGSFKPLPDLKKELVGAIGVSTFGGKITYNPLVNLDGATIVNYSNQYVVGAISFHDDIESTGDKSFVIAPNSSITVSFEDLPLADDKDAIANLSFTAVEAPTSNGFVLASDLTEVTLDKDNAFMVIVNGIES